MSVGAVAAIGGAYIASSGAKSAGKTQAAGADAASQVQQQQYQQTRSDQMPFLNSGYGTNNLLGAYLGLATPVEYSADDLRRKLIAEGSGGGLKPGSNEVWDEWQLNDDLNTKLAEQKAAQEAYSAAQQNGTYGSLLRNFGEEDLSNDTVFNLGHQYAQDQGQLAVNRLAAASGNYLSGATINAAQKQGANIANQFGNDAYNRFNTNQGNIYNRLAGVSGAGQQAVNQVASSGQNMANNVSQNIIGAANARGASQIAGANAITSGIGQALNYTQQNNYLNSLNNSGGSTGGWYNNVYKKP